MCQEIPRGYSRKRENVKVLTNSGEQRGQDQNDKNTTLKTKKQMNNMDPTKKLGVDLGAHEWNEMKWMKHEFLLLPKKHENKKHK